MLRDLPFQTIGDVAGHGLDLHAELLQVGGPVTLAFLWCNSCLWEIDHVQLDKPPWSGTARRYPCPGCGGRVEWPYTFAAVWAWSLNVLTRLFAGHDCPIELQDACREDATWIRRNHLIWTSAVTFDVSHPDE